MKREFYVYMLRCKDDSLYVGVTNSIERRFIEHQEGRNVHCYTFQRRPVTLAFCACYQYIIGAIAREKQLKGWGRQKKEALIEEYFERLIMLSRRRTPWTAPQKMRYSLHRKTKRLLGRIMLRDALAEASAPQHDK